MEEREPPSPYFGDYPHGAYWSAITSDRKVAGVDDQPDYFVEGSELRVMWDEGAGPLWGEAGLLPSDPQWLKRALGLSDALITDLLEWISDMTAQMQLPGAEWRQREQRLHTRGRELAERAQGEIGSRFRVWYDA